jgi:hypothetical protein
MQCNEKGLNADERFCLNVEETETVAYQMLMNLLQIRPKIIDVFKALCYGKCNVLQLIDGSNEVCSDYPSLWLLLLSSVQCYLLLFEYTYSMEIVNVVKRKLMYHLITIKNCLVGIKKKCQQLFYFFD